MCQLSEEKLSSHTKLSGRATLRSYIYNAPHYLYGRMAAVAFAALPLTHTWFMSTHVVV